MDPLTHTATGLFLARCGFKRWSPLATPILLIAANAPDIDTAALFGGSLNYLHYHRHLTHSIAASPVIAILPVLLVRAVARKPVRWLGAFFAAWIGVASHLLLDYTNIYGIRLLLPFSGRWLRLDHTPLFDPWIWSVILLALAGPFLSRLVSMEITSGAARPSHYGRGFAVFALAFLLCYNAGRGVLHSRAVAVLDSWNYRDRPPIRTAAGPAGANPLRWHGIVETSDFVALGDVNLAGEFDPTRTEIFEKAEPSPAIEAARRTKDFQEFMRFSQIPFWRSYPAPEPQNARRVELIDLRFGTPHDPGFMVSALVDANARVLETSFQFGRVRPR